MGVRRVAVALTALIVSFLVTLFTASMVESYFQPALAIQLWGSNPLALGAWAGQTVTVDVPPARRQAGVAAARRALMLDPLNVSAARALGINAGLSNDGPAAISALRYGETMSRRDLMIETALIEWRVQHGDVAGALRHYDRALRTTESVPPLLSTLISASADPAIRTPVIGLLRRRPSWRPAFLVQLIDEHTPPDTVFGIIAGLQLNPADPAERHVLADAVAKLIGQGQEHVGQARRLLPAVSSPVRNPGFETDNLFPPLDWALADDANLNAVVEQGPSGHGRVLYLQRRNERGGEVAAQWLSLAAGRYRLSLMTGDVTGGEPSHPQIALTCADKIARSVFQFTLPAAHAAGRQVATPPFLVPSGCLAQRLTVALPSALENGTDRPWIDAVNVTPTN